MLKIRFVFNFIIFRLSKSISNFVLITYLLQNITGLASRRKCLLMEIKIDLILREILEILFHYSTRLAINFMYVYSYFYKMVIISFTIFQSLCNIYLIVFWCGQIARLYLFFDVSTLFFQRF